jgi:CheY-like chemotaxis protein
MDGYTATRELRRNPDWQRLPVIAMTASALTEDRERALASGMNAHITKPIHVDTMLRTMADWISTPIGRTRSAPPDPPTAAEPDHDAPALHRTDGLARCMGNEALYARLLKGFRDAEAGFADAVRRALTEQRHSDALRRAHDMKGLAATLGAYPLLEAALALHTTLAAGPGSDAAAQLDRTATELDRVLREIDTYLPPAT